MAHDKRDRAVPPVRFDRNAGPDLSFLVSIGHGVNVPSRAEKGGTHILHKKSLEDLWKGFNDILWTTDDSAIGRIEISGDPDSAIGRKKPNRNPGAKRLDKLSAQGCFSHGLSTA